MAVDILFPFVSAKFGLFCLVSLVCSAEIQYPCPNQENCPFKTIKGVWRFTLSETDECVISLHFDFGFSNKLLGIALEGLFKQLCN
jgi:ribosome-associated toxin RatA of RatAB toxin-antitoxin module